MLGVRSAAQGCLAAGVFGFGIGGILTLLPVTPPSVLDNGIVSAEAACTAKFVPKIEIREPGVICTPVAKLAPFKIPPLVTVGCPRPRLAPAKNSAITETIAP